MGFFVFDLILVCRYPDDQAGGMVGQIIHHGMRILTGDLRRVAGRVFFQAIMGIGELSTVFLNQRRLERAVDERGPRRLEPPLPGASGSSSTPSPAGLTRVEVLFVV